MSKKEFQQAFRDAMEAGKWSQIELAEASGLTRGQISHLANGIHAPSIETLICVCDAMSLTPNDFLGYAKCGTSKERQEANLLRKRIARVVRILQWQL